MHGDSPQGRHDEKPKISQDETRKCTGSLHFWGSLDVLKNVRRMGLSSGKRLHNYGKSPCLMGKSTISLAMFNSYVNVYHKVVFHGKWYLMTENSSVCCIQTNLHSSSHHGTLATTSWFSGPCLEAKHDAEPNRTWLVVLTILKHIRQWEGLSHILLKIKNVPNHQPGTQKHVHWTLGTPFHLMVLHHLTQCNGYVMGIPKFQTNPSSLHWLHAQ